MNANETKQSRFKRLAKQRGDRILKDIQLLGNLSNKGNYSYSEDEVDILFRAIADELKIQRSKFTINKKREIRF